MVTPATAIPLQRYGNVNCIFSRILCNDRIFQAVLAECQWDSKYEKITYGNNHLIVTHYWPKNLQRIEQTTESNVINADASDSFLSNAARLLWLSETDFCPGSIICNQVSQKILEYSKCVVQLLFRVHDMC